MTSSLSGMNETNQASTATVKESTIRMMTRLAQEHNAVNLSQGFPNEAPPMLLKLALAHAVLSGRPLDQLEQSSVTTEESLIKSLTDLLVTTTAASTTDDTGFTSLLTSTPSDVLNQYSPPMGRLDLRSSISEYYQRFYDYHVSPDDITVTLGATEAFASALRTVGRPGDKCVVLEPFHELYPSQCKIFYLEPVFVTLREEGNCWKYDPQELEDAVRHARILILNSPHNPTGKVFSRQELQHIVHLCTRYDVFLITDEIYEHMCFDQHHHYLIPKEFPEMKSRTLVCNSIGKSASATGWRLGWCLHPSHLSDSYRGIHDQLAVMSPHPMQYATLSYLKLPTTYFDGLAAKYQQRIHTLSDALLLAGFQVIVPQGAYYLFVGYRNVPALAGMTSMEAAMYMLKTIGVACVPGDNFFGKLSDETKNKYLRFAACRSNEDLAEAIKRIAKLTVHK
ncbi:aminotransferase [Nitzschia inconspicua]|uniref:Aminotransferase n=1 Tax=Nitzschia inconspicua TaxID=303405 RepID=A0A9K3P7S2_9STRA|nr:aminotransferase [Nitzschia inconspicua]KAG7361195.1 aminotransferase [Nitzschia inconspicua]